MNSYIRNLIVESSQSTNRKQHTAKFYIKGRSFVAVDNELFKFYVETQHSQYASNFFITGMKYVYLFVGWNDNEDLDTIARGLNFRYKLDVESKIIKIYLRKNKKII